MREGKKTTKNLSIILVNYQSINQLKECLFSLEKFLGNINLIKELIIVNNEISKLNLEITNFSWPVKIIELGKNIGFGSANNLAAQQASGKFLWLLNPDTLIVDQSIEQAVNLLENNQKIGIISPLIIEAKTKQPQSWVGGRQTTLWEIIFRNTFGQPWTKKTLSFVDWVSGTSMILKKELFHKLSGFDENFFMYFEDQDLCLRAKNLGFKIAFFPNSRIIHQNGSSWSNKKEQKDHYRQSQVYFFQKHRPSWEGKILFWVQKMFPFH